MSFKSRLSDIWSRIESLSAALWDENSPRAVDAQAIMEEFRGEIPRFESALAQANEKLALALGAHEQALASLRGSFEVETAGLKKRIALFEKTVHEKDAEIASMLATLAEHERRNSEAHAQTLKAAAASEEASVHKMDALYRDLTAKEGALEEAWQKRHAALESEYQRGRELQAARQTELEAKENRLVEEEGGLKRRVTDLELKAQALQSEYRLKQQEIEGIKTGLQRSITELVRQYQARLKGEHAPLTAPTDR